MFSIFKKKTQNNSACCEIVFEEVKDECCTQKEIANNKGEKQENK